MLMEPAPSASAETSARKKGKKTTLSARPCDASTHLVTLKILRSLSARKTLIPKDVPGLMVAQITSKMLPMITFEHTQTLAMSALASALAR